MKIGRNDPCHCGSGKKYKKCHMQADASDQREVRQLSGGTAVLDHYANRLNRDLAKRGLEHPAAQTAIQSWAVAEGTPPGEDAALVQHVLYDLNTGAGGPLILSAGELDSGTESDTLADVGKTLAATHVSLLEVLESKRGRGLRVLDRLTGETCFVESAELASQLEPMEMVLGRIGTWTEKKVLIPGWEKVWFRGRKAVVRDLIQEMEADGLTEEDEADVRQIWLRRQTETVVRRTREARPT